VQRPVAPHFLQSDFWGVTRFQLSGNGSVNQELTGAFQGAKQS
jgi:hypothetical protein